MSVNRREVLRLAGVGGTVLVGGSAIVPGRASAVTPVGTNAASDVSFVGSSSTGTRRKTILDVLEPWRSKVTAEIAGKTVIVKANLISLALGAGSADPALPVTHLDALRGVIDFIRSISASTPIIVGDSAAFSSITNIWSKAGYPVLTTEYKGVTLIDLGEPSNMPTVGQTIWKPDLSTTTPISMSGAFTDPKYYVISVCRPKTHDTVVMTATTKNILMGAPLGTTKINGTAANSKNLMHGRGNGSRTKQEEAKLLSYNLFQLANVLYAKAAPGLCVLDAWEGMQGSGPFSGTSVMQYCAVAGPDSLAVDRLSAMLMGFSDTATDPVDTANPSYTDMRYLKWISAAGFGNYDLSKINFIRGSLDGARSHIKKYSMHPNYASEVGWTGGPPTVIGTAAGPDAQHDPKPFLVPRPNDEVGADGVGVTFALPVEMAVRLGVFTPFGVEVRRLAYEYLPAGRYSVRWDGRDERGSRVPGGSYLVRLGFGTRSPGATETPRAQERFLEDRVRLAG